jgi:hypothetical protein
MSVGSPTRGGEAKEANFDWCHCSNYCLVLLSRLMNKVKGSLADFNGIGTWERIRMDGMRFTKSMHWAGYT